MNKLQLTKANPGNFIIENSIFERVKKFNNCLIDFTEQHLEIWLDREHKLFETDLNKKEENLYMITYIGIIEPNTSFRVIRSGEMIQSISQSRGDPDTITFGSMSSDGFAIHFNLVHSDNAGIKDFIESIDTTFISTVHSKAEANVEAHSKNVFFCPIKEDEVIEILKNPTLESIWGQEKGNSKYTLFLMIYTNESITGLGNSEVREYFHCKLCRLIDTEGEYENGMLNGVYEFEIINKPQLDFSFKQSSKHIGKRIYIDRKLFEDNFVIPIYLEDTYDDQIKNTKGLENINFN